MLASKQDVDEHVKSLLKQSKNIIDNFEQYRTISQLYYNVKEFNEAKSYIEQFIKAQSTSENGWVLKADIHNKLNDHISALHCYMNLYNIYQKKEYILSMYDCLMKFDFVVAEAKIFIDFLEKLMPDHEQLVLLKLKFFFEFDLFITELTKVELQMKNDDSIRHKRLYLLILERAPISFNAVSKCIAIISTCSVLNDLHIVQSCVNIFKKNMFSTAVLFKEFYCILLVSLMKNACYSDGYCCEEYLLELLLTLQVAPSNDLYIELKTHLLYLFVSFTHWSAIITNQMTLEVCRCFYSLYVRLCCIDRRVIDEDLPEQVCKWLNDQYHAQESTSYYMTFFADESTKEELDMKFAIRRVTEIIWPLKYHHTVHWEQMFGELASNKNIVIRDIQYNADFPTIMWHLMCHANVFRMNQSTELEPTCSMESYITSLLDTLLPSESPPDNIFRVDIITFLIGSALTYRKSMSNRVDLLPILPQCWKKIFVVDIILETWWDTAYGILSGKKRRSVIGGKLELLNEGLAHVRGVACKLTDIVKLQIGRFLFKYAEFCDVEKLEVLKRSESLIFSVIQSCMPTAPPTVPMRSFYPRVLPNLVVGNRTLFDVEVVSDEVLEKLRFDVCLQCVDAKLIIGGNLQGIDRLIDYANRTYRNHACRCVQMSRMYIRFATRLCERRKYSYYSTLALWFANKCRENIGLLVNQSERNEVERMLKQQVVAMDRADYNEYFRSRDVSNDVVCSNSYEKRKLTNCDSSRVQKTQQVNYCSRKCEKVTNRVLTDHDNIALLKLKLDKENTLCLNLITELDNMSEIIDNCLAHEDKLETIKTNQNEIKLELVDLSSAIDGLQYDYSSLESDIRQVEDRLIKSELITSCCHKVSDLIGLKFRLVKELIQGHFYGFEDFELKFLEEYFTPGEKILETKVKESENCDCKESNSPISELQKSPELLETMSTSSADDDYDNDVIIVTEPDVSEEQKQRAIALELPSFFYYFENLPPHETCSITSSDNIDVSIDEELLDDLPALTADELTKVFKIQCQFSKSNDDISTAMTPCTVKILITTDNEGLHAHMLIERTTDGVVCYYRALTKTWPLCIKLENCSNTIGWFDNGVIKSTNEKIALTFASESEIMGFKEHLRTIQCQIDCTLVLDL